MPKVEITVLMDKQKRRKKQPGAPLREVWPTMLEAEDLMVYPTEIDIFDGATTYQDLNTTYGSRTHFSVMGLYTDKFWQFDYCDIAYLDNGTLKRMFLPIISATYFADPGATMVTINPSQHAVPSTIQSVRIWNDCENWSGELTQIHNSSHDIQDHDPFIRTPRVTEIHCYSNSDSRVPASSIEAQFADTNDNRWERKPLTTPVLADRTDNKRWNISRWSKFNFDIKLKIGSDDEAILMEADSDMIVDEETEFIVDAENNRGFLRYNIGRKLPTRVDVAVTEKGSKSMGHYTRVGPNGVEYAYDKIDCEGIYYIPFDTSDTAKYKITTEPRYDAEEAEFGFRLGKQWDILVMPRRWAFYSRTRETVDLGTRTVVMPLTCQITCLESPAHGWCTPGAHQNCWSAPQCSHYDGDTGLSSGWGYMHMDESPCIDMFGSRIQLPYGPYLAGLESRPEMDSCVGTYACYFLFWAHVSDCHGNHLYWPTDGGSRCSYGSGISGTKGYAYNAVKTKNIYRYGLWWDRWPNQLDASLINNDVEPQRNNGRANCPEFKQDMEGENAYHFLSSIGSKYALYGSRLGYWFQNLQGSAIEYDVPVQAIANQPSLKVSPNPWLSLKHIFQKIAGIKPNPSTDDPETAPSVRCSQFWGLYGPPAFDQDNTWSKWDNYPYGCGMSELRAGELCAVIRKRDTDEAYYIWLRQDEELDLELTPVLGDYEGHKTSFESIEQDNSGGMDIPYESNVDGIYTSYRDDLLCEADCCDQMGIQKLRKITKMGRNIDLSLGASDPDLCHCQIPPYANPGKGVKSTGSVTLAAPVFIMISKERATTASSKGFYGAQRMLRSYPSLLNLDWEAGRNLESAYIEIYD